MASHPPHATPGATGCLGLVCARPKHGSPARADMHGARPAVLASVLTSLVILLASVQSALGASDRQASGVSLAGVHWYSGDSSMLDLSLPVGQRGWNVEVIFDVGWCDGDPRSDPGGARAVSQIAKNDGLVNIIRVDYRQMVAVPPNPGDFGGWADGFIKCTRELNDLASLYVVGNEPNIEGDIDAAQYAAAFNYLYSRRGEMPAGTQLIATFNSPFTPPEWMNSMASSLTGVDGFAIHTGGIRTGCQDPRQPCDYGGWPFDGAFRYYRAVIDNIPSKWWGKPIYITEFNTYTGDKGSEPQNNYIGDWINKAFEDVRNYNATRGSKPVVRALAWFVDRPQSWPNFSLRNIGAARADMGEEFKNPANRGASPPPSPSPVATTPVPTASNPPGQNVALGKVWQASSTYGPAWGGDKATDGLVSASSKWTSDGASPESWLALDLGQTFNLTGFVVRHAGAAGEAAYFNTQAFRLESGPSLDGPWTTLASVNNASQSNNVNIVALDGLTPARFVRLYITDAGIDNYARIPEFEVYAQGVVIPPTPIATLPSPPAPTVPPPVGCPPSLDFDAIRAQLNRQGEDLAFVKIGFHVQAAGNHTGLGTWEKCLDAAGVPFFLKSVSDAGKIMEAADLKLASGVPHTLVYRKCCQEGGQDYELPDYSLTPYEAAVHHWQLHLAALHRAFTITDHFGNKIDVLDRYKSSFWVETINEPDKGRSEWLAAFSYYTAQMVVADGLNYAAFAWSSGEPELEQWTGPWMRTFLGYAAAYPDRVAISLHEYEYSSDNLQDDYPYLVGRFKSLYQATDAMGIARPTVLITEFGWPGGPSSAEKAIRVDYPWASELYAAYPELKGAAIWCLGNGCPSQTLRTLRPMTEFALSHYYAIPLGTAPSPSAAPGPQGWGVPKAEYVPASVAQPDIPAPYHVDGDRSTPHFVNMHAHGVQTPVLSITVNLAPSGGSTSTRLVQDARGVVCVGANPIAVAPPGFGGTSTHRGAEDQQCVPSFRQWYFDRPQDAAERISSEEVFK
jgi:hypothetical protein